MASVNSDSANPALGFERHSVGVALRGPPVLWWERPVALGNPWTRT